MGMIVNGPTEDRSMKQYLVSIYQPDGGTPPPEVLQHVMREVRALTDEMKAAGAFVFTGGLFPATTATVLRQHGEDVLMTDGPYIEGKEHVGGFYVIKAADLDAALAWAQKLARIVPLPIELRPFQDRRP